MTIPIVGALDDTPVPPVSLVAASLQKTAIAAQAATAMALDGITLTDITIDDTGVTMTVVYQGSTQQIDQLGGWRGQGHLTADPVKYLHVKARQAAGLPT